MPIQQHYGYMTGLGFRGADDGDHRTKKQKERDIRKAKLRKRRRK